MPISSNQPLPRTTEPSDYTSGHLLVSAQFAEAYGRLPQAMRLVMEHGKRQKNYVFCSEEELAAAPERFGLNATQLEQYQETIQEYGGFTHQGREFYLPASAAGFSRIMQWRGLTSILEELRVTPDKWQAAVLRDMGLPEADVPNYLIDPMEMRRQHAPAIQRALKKNIGIECSPEQIDHENPREWLQMVALNAVASQAMADQESLTLPRTRRIYDQLAEKALKRAQSLEDAALTDGQILAAAKQSGAENERQPRFFTKDPQERSVLLKATRIVNTSLVSDPTRSKFRCRLNSGKSGHSIVMVLGNGNEAPEEHVIQTHTTDLDQALALKRALQSHMLNRKGISPLRYAYQAYSAELRPNEVIPTGLVAPEKPEVRKGYYVARFAGEEIQDGASKPVEMIFPLGIKHDEQTTDYGLSSAQKRLDWLARHVQVNDLQGIHETREELTQRMRKHFAAKSSNKQWYEAPNLSLESIEDSSIDLGFPGRLRGQTTLLNNPTIKFTGSGRDAEGNVSRDAEDSRNPTWHLSFTLVVQENDQEYKYQPNIRLQTSNEEAALRKAELIIEAIQQNFSQLAGKNEPPYSELRWQMRDAQQRGGIKLVGNHGVKLPSPEPEYLSDIVDDAVALVKSDFHVHSSMRAPEGSNNQHFSLAVHRGQEAEQDITAYKATDGRLLTRQFSATDPAVAETFAGAVNDSFRDAVQETYATRRTDPDGTTQRIQLQRFNDRTIENRFHSAVEAHLNNPRFSGKVVELEHASSITSRERASRARE